jgi:hypothetical protein
MGRGVCTGREKDIVSGPMSNNVRGLSMDGKGTLNIRLATYLSSGNGEFLEREMR